MWQTAISAVVASALSSAATYFLMRSKIKAETSLTKITTIDKVIEMWKELVETLTKQSQALTDQVGQLTQRVEDLTAENKLLRQEIHDFVLKSSKNALIKAEGKAEGIAEKQIEVDQLNKASNPDLPHRE